jgi:4-alpha-glucanotransferase
MGFAVEDEGSASRSLAALDEEERSRLLDPVGVVFEEEEPRLRLRIEPRGAAYGRVDVEVQEESGEVHEGTASVSRRGTLTGPPLRRLPLGIHRVRVVVDTRTGTREAQQTLVLAPRRCLTPETCVGERRLFGLWTNLYTVREERGFGIGDLTSLRALVDFAGEVGAGFVGINPLHAVRNRPPEIGPYGPVSRLFRNAIYLDLEAVPELETSTEARALLESDARRREIEALRAAPALDYPRIVAAQRPVLEALHRTFLRLHRGHPSDRGRAFDRFCDRQGPLLGDFATFAAIEDRLTLEGVPRDWREWPAAYREPDTEAIREFRRDHAEKIDFHRFLQFEMDRQLGAVAAEAHRVGLPLGIYQDLALGTAASGFDPWVFRGQFVHGANLGAPPDEYTREGQDWGLPPLDPRQLAADGYRYWILLLRAALAHSGALRLDHIMGLFRQYWIPVGSSATEGAYVRFPARELLALLALESHRKKALVIGEDLGTVPTGLQSQLARAGVLSSRVLLFERDRRGTFRSAARYSRRALVTANTHDLPTLAGFWSGCDLDIRRETGAIADDAALAKARRERARERRALVRRLATEGTLASTEEPESFTRLCAAVNRFLCRTPAPLVGISLDDLAGEIEPVNVPGAPLERYSSWTRRMRLTLGQIRRSAEVESALAGTTERAFRPR